MPKLSLWNSGRKSNDYRFTDKIISEFFNASGTAAYLHKYVGAHDQSPAPADGSPRQPVALGETSIQDVLFLENRDRKYERDVYELRACYNVQDNDLDLRQFGLFLTGDTLFIEFHLNDMISLIGRKIISGDVIELPHQRDDALLDEAAPAINRFYVVDDASKAAEGYSATWWPHIWRVKLSPMTNAQEYADILDKQATNPFGVDQGRLGDLMSTLGKEMEINEAVVEAAKESVGKRYFESRQFWVMPGTELTSGYPWLYTGDAEPPNGAIPTGSGTSFPAQPDNGDYYVRTDYDPRALFRFDNGRWRMQEQDYRQEEWSVAHRVLKQFINNDTTTTFDDGSQAPEKQSLFKAVKPRADF